MHLSKQTVSYLRYPAMMHSVPAVHAYQMPSQTMLAPIARLPSGPPCLHTSVHTGSTCVCRCYSYQGATGARGAAHRGQHLDYDSKLGHALTLVQLGKWQEAAEMFKSLNEFYKEQCAAAHSACFGTVRCGTRSVNSLCGLALGPRLGAPLCEPALWTRFLDSVCGLAVWNHCVLTLDPLC